MPNICIAEMILDWATFSILKEDDREFIEYWEKGGLIPMNSVKPFRFLSNISLFFLLFLR